MSKDYMYVSLFVSLYIFGGIVVFYLLKMSLEIYRDIVENSEKECED